MNSRFEKVGLETSKSEGVRTRVLFFTPYASRFTVYDFTHPSFEFMMVLVLFVEYLQTLQGEELVHDVDRLGALVDQA